MIRKAPITVKSSGSEEPGRIEDKRYDNRIFNAMNQAWPICIGHFALLFCALKIFNPQ